MLGKNRTIPSTNWENQHYFETLSALTLKIRTSLKHHVQFEVNSDHDCKSWWHFGAGLANCAKRACTLHVDLLSDSHIVQHFWCCKHSKCCRSVHFFQWTESEHNYVILPIIIIISHCVRWISEALNEHYLKFWALNRALNAEKMRDTQSTKSKFYGH